MGWLRNLERWLRRNIWNPGKASIASELKSRLPEIEAAVEKAVTSYAAATGGEPFALFLTLAIQRIGLGAAAAKWVQAIIDRLEAGTSRAQQPASAAGREWVAKTPAHEFLRQIREEAGKA